MGIEFKFELPIPTENIQKVLSAAAKSAGLELRFRDVKQETIHVGQRKIRKETTYLYTEVSLMGMSSGEDCYATFRYDNTSSSITTLKLENSGEDGLEYEEIERYARALSRRKQVLEKTESETTPFPDIPTCGLRH